MTDHLKIEQQLQACGSDSRAAESHGVLCGLLCSGVDDALGSWLAELLPGYSAADLLQKELRGQLEQLYKDTQEAISGPGLGFSPLLPGDDQPIGERARALTEWCQGFLYGVGLAGIDLDRQLSEETREAMRDFTEITRMDLEALDESEEQEDALTEITEFLWVAAMLVHEEVVHDPTARS